MYPGPGEIIEGKYRIDRQLGEGAMGIVFAATHMLRRAPVALKFMSAQAAALPEAVDRFMNEAISASQIESAHVVKIFDVGRWGDLPFMVMEFLVGRDLSQELVLQRERGTQMEVGRALHFVVQILRATQVAHGLGIIHRDLKPANAFVITHEGEPDFVKLLDFGISKKSEAGSVSLTRTNVAMGTPLYMAPEQARSARDADARSDVYSVAAILYECLTGRPPLEADSYNMLLYKLFQEEPPHVTSLRRDLHPGLAEVVHRGLAKDPQHRFISAAQFAEALLPWAEPRSNVIISRMLATTGGHARLSIPQPAVNVLPAPAPTVAIGAGTGPGVGYGSGPHAAAATLANSDPAFSGPHHLAPAPYVAAPLKPMSNTSVAFAPQGSSPNFDTQSAPRSKTGAIIAIAGVVTVAAIVGGVLLLQHNNNSGGDDKRSNSRTGSEPAAQPEPKKTDKGEQPKTEPTTTATATTGTTTATTIASAPTPTATVKPPIGKPFPAPTINTTTSPSLTTTGPDPTTAASVKKKNPLDWEVAK